MLGYPRAELGEGEYLVQVKPRLLEEMQGIGDDLKIRDAAGNGFLSCRGVCGDPFSQDGHNGADYIVVVPDEVLRRMEPFYSELVADLAETAPLGLADKLDDLGTEESFTSQWYQESDLRGGSDMIISSVMVNQVRDNLIPEMKYMLASLMIPLLYLGLVFVCVAVTVLSVQQLSDSAKYKANYDVLAKMGLGRAQIRRLIGRQLSAYYLCPAILAIVISGKMILFVSSRFVEATGVPAAPGEFFLRSICLFFGIYLVYFAVTYVCFLRNVQQDG